MKCQSTISTFCKKTFKKAEAKHIWVEENGKQKHLEVCGQCFWILKQRAKESGRGGYPTQKKQIKNGN